MNWIRELWRRLFGREEEPGEEPGSAIPATTPGMDRSTFSNYAEAREEKGQILVANRYGEEVELEAGGDGQVLVANGYGDMSWKEEFKERPKHRCDFCKGMTFDDYLGNCAACGAPREAEEEVDPYWNVRTRPRLELWESASTDPGLVCDMYVTKFCSTD